MTEITGCWLFIGQLASRRMNFAPKLKDIKRKARQQAGSLQWWFRDRYRLPPNDPRFLALSTDDLALEFWTAYYAESAAKGEAISFEDEDDEYDLAAIEAALEARERQADQAAMNDPDPEQWEVI